MGLNLGSQNQSSQRQMDVSVQEQAWQANRLTGLGAPS